MKQFCLIFFAILLCSRAFSQAGIYMYSNQLTGEISTHGSGAETLIQSFSKGYANSSTIGQGGAGAGKASASDFTILKSYSAVTLAMLEFNWTGRIISKIEFRFYNTSNVIYYRITLGNVLISSAQASGTGCPNGCPGIDESYGFSFESVKEEDLITHQSKCWDFKTNSATCPL